MKKFPNDHRQDDGGGAPCGWSAAVVVIRGGRHGVSGKFEKKSGEQNDEHR